jgi:hypothetical protein
VADFLNDEEYLGTVAAVALIIASKIHEKVPLYPSDFLFLLSLFI